MGTEPIDTLVTGYYLRLRVNDRPMVLGAIANVFGAHQVSLAAMEMKTLEAGAGEIVFLTHPCKERDFVSALERLKGMDVIDELGTWLRVEG